MYKLQKNDYSHIWHKALYSNGFEKAKAGGQKFLKHLQTVSTKLHGKHWLYTVLANRFNVC